jgi:hypothetical protein
VKFAAKIGLIAYIIGLATSSGFTQEIGYLDLTTPAPRMPIRSAKRFSGESCGMGAPTTRPDVTITLISLDKSQYSLGEKVTFEAKIENSGKETIQVPWCAELAALEPSDPSQSFSYCSASFGVVLTVPDSNHYLFVSGFSYGSTDLSSSIRELRPGQSFTVRARDMIEGFDKWWAARLTESAPPEHQSVWETGIL